MTGDADVYDLVVIGGGSAGLTIGKYGPVLGARVAVVEAERLGGDCTWYGCVPSKALLASANAWAFMNDAERFGLPPRAQREPREPLDLARVMERIRRLQTQIYEQSDSPEQLRAGGCDVIEGRGRFVGPDALEVEGRVIRSRYFCVATGSRPVLPPIDGIDTCDCLTNQTIFQVQSLPPRLLVIGGGAIGLELGQAFARLGSRATMVEMAAQLVPNEDPELAAMLRAQLEAEGIVAHTQCTAARVFQEGGLTRLSLRGDCGIAEIEAEALLVAAGRVPNLEGLGLETAGVQFDPARGIRVDKTLRTSNPRIYACGDVLGQYPFTHVAAYEAGLVLRNALFPYHENVDYRFAPWATFTEPALARVGMTEAQAREKHGDAVHVYRHPFPRVDRALLDGKAAGLVKLITAGRRERIVGAHILGPSAGELIHEVVIAMQAGMSAPDLAQTMFVYPTLSEGVRYAALEPYERNLRAGRLPWLLRRYRGMEALPRRLRRARRPGD